MKFCFIDTETGGLDPENDALLSIGMLIVDGSTGEVIDQLEEWINPFTYPTIRNISTEALKVNGLDLAELTLRGKNALQVQQIVEQFLRSHAPVIFAGYNVPFDISFLKGLIDYEQLIKNKVVKRHVLDIMSLCINALRATQASDLRLRTMIEKYLPDAEEQTHGALNDITQTYEIWRVLNGIN